MLDGPDLPSSLQHFTLANGLRVFLHEDHRAPLVSVQLWYHVGSSYEPDGHSGLSHALEHLMFEGSSKLAPGEYVTLMTRLGGAPNAYTGEDATVYPITLTASRMEVALEAMADAMASATLDDAPYARELAVVMAERRANVDNSPLALALERNLILAHGQSRYATPVIGHQQDLQHMTAAAARTWYRSWYHPNNATLVIAGSTDLQRLRTLVERHFAAIAANRLPDPLGPLRPTALAQRTERLSIAGLREGVIMSFNVPSLVTANDPTQAHALQLIPELLSAGTASRLRRALIQEQPILQALRADYQPYLRGDSLLRIYAFSNPAHASPQQAAQQIMQQLELLRQAPPSSSEIERAKARLRASRAFARDDIAEQAAAIGRFAACGLDPLTLVDQAKAIESVTGQQLQQAAHDYLQQSRLSTTLMHDQESNHG